MRPPDRILIAARILVGQTQRELAKATGFTQKTVYLIEKGEAGFGAVERLTQHFEQCGIIFIKPDGSEGWGVRASFLTADYRRNTSDQSSSD
ncbi:helix-turn-helix domain-containing protein [Ensifer adhaerens]|uniref:helix-turn-helix domain-containing protein n=1 Tax=Ensifer adhaerens TaxID=106592 RepID=UPI001CC09D98|nr:helix-turn-helix transcriptional regulator [Ensifer adhaerens]MBZ7921740.1 helix-turn-helix domain-containing protein [Ensifer adhaerens]UAY01781.1 helix-turn-helix domain-containing protein [Ensifer adhaerens]